MATAAQARRATVKPRPYEERLAPPAPRRATQPRRRAVSRAGVSRMAMVFIICLTALAVGRVALSFAVVQKTLQTDAIARQERQVSADNARLSENLAQLSSAVHIRWVAEHELGLVDPDHVSYLKAPHAASLAKDGASR
jgi:cell division protein FtsL